MSDLFPSITKMKCKSQSTSPLTPLPSLPPFFCICGLWNKLLLETQPLNYLYHSYCTSSRLFVPLKMDSLDTVLHFISTFLFKSPPFPFCCSVPSVSLPLQIFSQSWEIHAERIPALMSVLERKKSETFAWNTTFMKPSSWPCYILNLVKVLE